ncbi:hypothetical protein N9L68_05025 [bacterium]|nr:hypothetical protein [bacterium]
MQRVKRSSGAAQPASNRQNTSNAAQPATSADQHAPEAICFTTHEKALQRIERAEWIVNQIGEELTNWYQLSTSAKKPYDSVDDLRKDLEELLLTRAGRRHAGAISGTAHQM